MPEVAQGVVAVTPSDTADVAKVNGKFPIALRANGAGNVNVVHNDDSSFTYTVGAGEILPVSVKRVKSTGTTATGIAAWYY